FHDVYQRQAALLLKLLPYVAEEECFALKGGTAINLFVRDMPRLSVDIDLTFLPVSLRGGALVAICGGLEPIAEGRTKAGRGAQISGSETMPEKAVTKLL